MHRLSPAGSRVSELAWASLPTAYGTFQVTVFRTRPDRAATVVLSHGQPNGRPALVRIHSQCLTGDALGSRRCDCGGQLEASLKRLARSPWGVLLYLPQEGRGIGLVNKIKSYQLQDQGLDTVEANTALGFPPDARSYAAAVKILLALKIKKIILLTNNPDKECQLLRHGVTVVGTRRLETKPHRFNRRYLQIKKRKLGHRLKLV